MLAKHIGFQVGIQNNPVDEYQYLNPQAMVATLAQISAVRELRIIVITNKVGRQSKSISTPLIYSVPGKYN